MVSKDITKGLTLTAFGFLFVLINININEISISPAFIGWLLFFLAFPCFGKYGEGKEYLRWAALILTIITAVEWTLEVTNAVANTDVLKTIVGLANAVFMFLYFDILINVARDYGHEETANKLSTLKYVNIGGYIGTVVFAVLYALTKNTIMAVLTVVCGVVVLVTAIITCVRLFKLKKEIANGTSVA